MNVYEEALLFHEKLQGKLRTGLKDPLDDNHTLGLAYTPGVAQPCREIARDESLAYKYTSKANTVAVISDGSAVLGLGNIGGLASLPVMEGKAALIKKFGDVNAVPIVTDLHESKDIINFVKALAPTFGAIHLEDISAPRCVEIERTLIDQLDIPVFHDDQHGTSIVLAASVINALKLVKKELKDVTVLLSGAGAAGSAIVSHLNQLGVGNILAFDINGIIRKSDCEKYADFLTKEIAEVTNKDDLEVSFKDAFQYADVFIGVSAAGIVSQEMVASMKKDPIVFSMANPEPEITYDKAKAAGAAVVGTGRSDSPNQINNILSFPGVFKGALKANATKINGEMKMAATYALANLIKEEELSEEYVIPTAFDSRVADAVADSIAEAAIKTGVVRK